MKVIKDGKEIEVTEEELKEMESEKGFRLKRLDENTIKVLTKLEG